MLYLINSGISSLSIFSGVAYSQNAGLSISLGFVLISKTCFYIFMKAMVIHVEKCLKRCNNESDNTHKSPMMKSKIIPYVDWNNWLKS